MSLRSSRMYGAAVPTMPPGLVELMEGLAKDVLKNSPDNIYEFCAQHMKKLIEIRDCKERKNDSPSIEKITKVQEKDQGKTEINQKLDDTEVEAANVNESEVEASKKETYEKQADEEFVNDSHESEKENESEQKHIEEGTIGSNKTTTVESANNENNSYEFEIKSLGTKEEILHELPESQNKNPIDINSSNENLVLLVGDSNITTITEPICNTNTKNDDYSINEGNSHEKGFVNKDENESQSAKALDFQSDDQSVLEVENTEYNLNLNNDLDNLSSPQKDCSGNEKVLNESNGIHTESCINELSIPNKDYSHVTIDRAILDSSNLEEKLHLQKSNETEDYYNDVDNDAANSMDLEKAAITIQKVFRAFLFKSKTLSTEEATNIDLNYLVDNDETEAVKDPSFMSKERRSGISRMDTVLQTVNEEKSLSLSTDDSSTLSSAATIIQAHVRGFLVRCKMPFNKTVSTVSVLDSDVPSAASLDSDQNQQVNKTILNIHIVPEGNNFISRDASLVTSLDLSLDGSPRQSSNLHPLGYDLSERRKQLKREDAIQSVTPPSNNSGKLSEEVDSVKEIVLNDSTDEPNLEASEKNDELKKDDHLPEFEHHSSETRLEISKGKFKETRNITSDEADVVTPFVADGGTVDSSANVTTKLLHSGEFHDIVLPTVVSRSNSSVVREFRNVLVYFLLWNPS